MEYFMILTTRFARGTEGTETFGFFLCWEMPAKQNDSTAFGGPTLCRVNNGMVPPSAGRLVACDNLTVRKKTRRVELFCLIVVSRSGNNHLLSVSSVLERSLPESRQAGG